MISHELRCIFLHPNKCGGKSIEKAIWNVTPKIGSADHRTPSQFIQEYGQEVWDSYFKFGFCRNPWDRMVSVYHGRKQILKKDIREPFHEWVFVNTVRPQSLWLREVDFVGRFERFEEDFEKVKERLNIDVKLPHENASKRKHYTEYYDEPSIEIVRSRFREDIERYEYEYGT